LKQSFCEPWLAFEAIVLWAYHDTAIVVNELSIICGQSWKLSEQQNSSSRTFATGSEIDTTNFIAMQFHML